MSIDPFCFFTFSPRAADKIAKTGRKKETFTFTEGFSPCIGETVSITTPSGHLMLAVRNRIYSVDKSGNTVVHLLLDLLSADSEPEWAAAEG